MRCFLMMIAVVGLVGCGESWQSDREAKAKAEAEAAAEAERERLKRIVDDIRVTKLSVPDHTFVPKPEPRQLPPVSHKKWVIVAVVLVVFFVVAIHVKNTCPKCKRRGALRKTGKRRDDEEIFRQALRDVEEAIGDQEELLEDTTALENSENPDPEELSRRDMEGPMEEVKCKYCGDRHWREIGETH